MEAFWIILVASLAAINCSLVGTYLVLRKVAMMADAITHAVLPGIVLAFLFTGSKGSLVMLIGAGSTGIIATVLTAFLHQKVRLQSDASIGINFTWMFALGIILISLFSRKVDLDPDCVLYGEVAYAPLATWKNASGISLGPQSMYILALMLLVNLGFVLLSYKELAITTFDAAFATTIGIHTTLWYYLLMGATSFTAVASFEVAGAILVVALFVVPASTAYLLTQRLSKMLIVASLLGIGIAISGYYLAVWLNGSIAGAMATIAGGIFLVVFLVRQHQQQIPSSQAVYIHPKDRAT
ncbi:MAG: metal ABC transporter permease [Bacteroidota bacterium]